MVENKDVSKNNDSKKIITMLILIVTVMVCTTSATYAYFALTATNNVATGTAATASLSLTVTQEALKTGTNTGVMVPQKESALATAMNSTNKCVDGNGNIICKVYKILVENRSTAGVKVNGTIKFSGNSSMPNLKWKKTTNATTLGSATSVAISAVADANAPEYDILTGSVCTISSADDCTDVSLAKNDGTNGSGSDSATYYIVIWINETGSTQTDTGTWRATVRFEGENGTGITSTIVS